MSKRPISPMVTVVGVGALGSLLSARLIAAGIKVQLLQRPGAQFDRLRERGVVISKDVDGDTHQFQPNRLAVRAAELDPADLVLITLKSYATEQLRELRELLKPEGAVLSVQNGLGNLEWLQTQVAESQLLAGICSYGAYRNEAGEVYWGGEGDLQFGPWQPAAGAVAHRAVEILQRGNLKAALVESPRPLLWKKLAVNLLTNPLTALIGCTNGELLDQPESLALMQRLLGELLVAADRAGVQLNYQQLWDEELRVLQQTAANRSSMLQDVLANRPTEIESIAGSVLSYATNDYEFPSVRTLYALLKARHPNST